MLKPTGRPRVVFEGRIFEVVHQDMVSKGKTLTFETARRAPGVRLIIVEGSKILLTREYRSEIGDYDYRLPGGKVFDTLAEYRDAMRSKRSILSCAKAAAKKECREETGIIPLRVRHFSTSKAGGTVEWDLYYFVIEEFSQGVQHLETGEHIVPGWYSRAQAKRLIAQGKMHEDRSVGILCRFLMGAK